MTQDQNSLKNEMGILEHLGELRKRLLYSALAVMVAGSFAYSYSAEAFGILCRPYRLAFPNEALIGLGPAEAFVIKIKVAIYLGLMLALPVIGYQIWAFVSPALYVSEKKTAAPFVISASFFFLVGAVFCYYAVLPLAFQFFRGEYLSIGITPTVRISEQISTVLTCLIGFGAAFELPVITFVLVRFGLVNHQMMIHGFRYATVVIFVVAAILTPPDVVSQLLLAFPLMLLYGLSIGVAKVWGRTHK